MSFVRRGYRAFVSGLVAASLAFGLISSAGAVNPNWTDGTWNGCYYLDQAQHYNGSGPVYSWAETWGSAYCTDRVSVAHYAWYGGAYQGSSSGWRWTNEYTQYNAAWPTSLLDCYHQVEVDGSQQSPNAHYYVS